MIPIQSNPKHQACLPKIRQFCSNSHLYPKFPTPALSIANYNPATQTLHLSQEFLLDPPSGLTSPSTPLLSCPSNPPESCLSTPVLDTVGVIPLHPASEFG